MANTVIKAQVSHLLLYQESKGQKKRQNHTELGEEKATSKCNSIKLQMDVLWALFGTTTEVRLVSISEQNNSSTTQVKGLPHVYRPLDSPLHFVDAVGQPSFSLYEKLSKKHNRALWICAAMPVCMIMWCLPVQATTMIKHS